MGGREGGKGVRGGSEGEGKGGRKRGGREGGYIYGESTREGEGEDWRAIDPQCAPRGHR